MSIAPEKDIALRQLALRNTVSNYLGQIVTLGTGFILTPFILHQMGASDYGLWLLAGATVAYGGLLDLGIATAVIKYVAEFRARGEHEQLQRLVSTTLSLYTILGLFAFLLSVALAPFFPILFQVPDEAHTTATRLILLMGLSLGISIPSILTNAVLRGLQRFDLANIIFISGTLLTAGATVAVLLLGGGIIGMVAVSISVNVAMQLPAIWFVRRSAPELRFTWRGTSLQLMRTVFSYSWSLFVGQLAGQLQTKSDELVIGAMLPISSVTPYGLARRLSEVAQSLTRQFVKVLMPMASQLHAEDDQARLRAIYLASTRLTLASFLPIGCTIIILARPLLRVWVGEAYTNSATLVLILTVASLIATIEWPAGAMLQGINRHRFLAAISIGSGLVNLALSIALVPSFGVVGVALGTLIPTIIESLVFVMPYTMRILKVSLPEMLGLVLLPTFAPAIPTVIVLFFLQEAIQPANLFMIGLIAGAGLLTYLVGYLAFGASAHERQLCRTLALHTARLTRAQLRRWHG